GRVMLTVGQGWVYQASGTRELVAGEWMAELAR
ncbi:MAG: hypothetical protein RLZZ162_792, partial [Verrucomicrobiota bacterium]